VKLFTQIVNFGQAVKQAQTESRPSFEGDEATQLVQNIRAGDPRSKNKGKTFPENPTGTLTVVDIPISSIRKATIDYMRESTDPDRVARYVTENITTPIYMRINQKGNLVVSDGGHRLLAAIDRGDTHIKALVPQWYAEKMEKQSGSRVTHGMDKIAIASTKLLHGTRIEKSGMDIASSGELQPGAQATGRGFMSPVGGKVYITESLQTAIMYALGADMAGHDLPESFIGKDGRYGYIFEIDNADRSVMQPDEDTIGELIYDKKAPLWLLGMLNRFVAPSRIERLKRGEYAYFASVGKQLLARMDDFQKAEILKLVPNAAHQGPIKVSRGWRIDKKNSIFLLRDGSNFFEYAEEVPIGNGKAV